MTLAAFDDPGSHLQSRRPQQRPNPLQTTSHSSITYCIWVDSLHLTGPSISAPEERVGSACWYAVALQVAADEADVTERAARHQTEHGPRPAGADKTERRPMAALWAGEAMALRSRSTGRSSSGRKGNLQQNVSVHDYPYIQHRQK